MLGNNKLRGRVCNRCDKRKICDILSALLDAYKNNPEMRDEIVELIKKLARSDDNIARKLCPDDFILKLIKETK